GAHRWELPRCLADRAEAHRRRRRAGAVHQARQAMLRIAFPEEVARELRQAAEARFAVPQRLLRVLAAEELAEEAADGRRRVDEGLVGLLRGVPGESEQRDGAILGGDRDGEGGEAPALGR